MTTRIVTTLTLGLLACGGAQPANTSPSDGAGDRTGQSQAAGAGDEAAAADRSGKAGDAGEFKVNTADKSSRPRRGSLKATDSHAAVRFFVVDKGDNAAIEGIVISLTAPGGEKYYTRETDADGFAEVLVPIGKTYELVYLSLGRRNIAARVKVANEPNLNLKLTMRYKRIRYPKAPDTDRKAEPEQPKPAPRFVLENVRFASAKATITTDSYARLDAVVEYMTYKKSARIEISGHTDNVGSKKGNKKLSQRRADAVRDYLVSKGIDRGRIETVGYGDERPIASNDTDDGREKNRRIEATEL